MNFNLELLTVHFGKDLTNLSSSWVKAEELAEFAKRCLYENMDIRCGANIQL